MVLAATAVAGALIADAGIGSAASSTQVCAPVPSPTGTGYWTPFGDAQWTASGLLTSSQAAPSQPYGVTCGGASVYAPSLPTSDPAKITALSFDFVASTSGPSGVSPRLVVCFSDGANCASNGYLAPRSWTAGAWTHVDGFAPGADDFWGNSGGSCGSAIEASFSAIVACHPGATVTQVAVVNDAGSLYPAGEQVTLNNLTFNNVVAREVPPVLGQSAEIAPLSGAIEVRQPGARRFVKVKTIMKLRYGAVVHATGGHVQVIAAKPGSGFQSGEFYDGGFNLSQGGSGTVQAALTGVASGCKQGRTAAARDARAKTFKLWGHVKGHFSTRGRYGSASVQGTIWLTENRCDGTFFHVVRGVLKIRDFTRHRTIVLRAGHSYLAAAPKPKPTDTFDNDNDNDKGLTRQR